MNNIIPTRQELCRALANLINQQAEDLLCKKITAQMWDICVTPIWPGSADQLSARSI